MKLSNRLLIGFFAFIFLYLTAAFTEIRFWGHPYIVDDSNSIAESVDITGITYLVVNGPGKKINVIGSDQSTRIEVRSITGDVLKTLKYNISGDTLTIFPMESVEKERLKIAVYVPDNTFTGIKVDNAEVFIEGLEEESLTVFQKAGRVRIIDNSRIGKLHVEASDRANFHMSDADVDTLSAQVDNSELLFYSPVRLLKGSMKNESYLRVNRINEIQFKKDDSSRLYIPQ